MEGTWQTPDTPEKQAKLVELLSTDLPVGADATNATEQLYDLLGDDELFDQLQALANRDANADARQIILNRMQELDQDPDVMKVITSLNIDATAEMNPPEQTPADLDDDPANPGSWTPERMAAAQQKGSYKGMDETVKDPADQTEDPEGTAQPAYPEYAEDLSSILKHAGVPAQERPAPDYELEMDETANPGVTPADIDGVPKQELDEFAPLAAAIGGALGRAAVGTAAGTITRGLASMAGSSIGNAVGDAVGNDDEIDEASRCNMTEAGESCPVHGLKECGMYEASALQGQYGHSGRMKPVDKDITFLDRLKELSGFAVK
jgi:hypothetical protein